MATCASASAPYRQRHGASALAAAHAGLTAPLAFTNEYAASLMF